MSNDYDWEDDNELDAEETPTDDKGMNNLRKAKRANEKYIKELEAQLGIYLEKDYERIITDTLKSKGVNTKAARLLLNDLETVDEESISKWLLENGDLIGYQPQQDSTLENADIQALKRQDAATNSADTPAYSEDVERAILNATSEEEIMSIIKNLG